MLDFNIYLKHPENFSLPIFEQYCISMGLNVALHPSFELEKWNGGFVPARFVDSRFKQYQDDSAFLTGFELYFERCDRNVSNLPNGSDYPYVVGLRCGVADSFELFMAFVFGAYLTKTCEGVFEDPQNDVWCEDFQELEDAVGEILTELLDMSKNGGLRTHRFDGWCD